MVISRLCSYLKELGLSSQGQADGSFSEWPSSSKIMLERVTGDVVISEVDAVTYVVLSKAAKHMPYGQSVGITLCITFYPKCRKNEVVITEFNCMEKHVWFFICWPGSPRQYSDLLRAGLSWDRIPLRGEIFHTRPDGSSGPPVLMYNECRVSFPRATRPGCGVDYPPSSAEVKERVELYLYSTSRSSGPVLG
jgi:hypothetical protein